MRERYLSENRRKEVYPMNLWDSKVDRLFQEMSRMFDEFFVPDSSKCMTRTPRIDFYRREGKVIAEIELPGIDPENMDVKIYRDRLVINATKNQESSYDEDFFLCSERYFGNISRVVSFPVEVDPDTASASYRKGVLRIEVQELEQSERGKTVDVVVEEG